MLTLIRIIVETIQLKFPYRPEGIENTALNNMVRFR